MKITSLNLILLLIFSAFCGQAIAQENIDPSTATLFRGSSGAESEDLDSSRFTITQPAETPEPKAKTETALKKKKTVISSQTKIQVKPTPPSALAPVVPAPNNTAPASVMPEKHSIGDQFKYLLLGNNEDIDDFRKQIHPSDRRNNAVEISVAPVYIYDNSSSNYSFRNFTTQSPGFEADAKLWLTPFFGLHADFMTSMGDTIKSPSTKQVVQTTLQNIEIGAKFRKHFGMQRKSSSLTWGFDFIQNNTTLPSSTPDRVSTATSGLSVSLQLDLPSSVSYSSIIGVAIQPRLVHSEISDANIASGGKNDTNAIAAWLGGDWILDRRHQMFWKIQERVEQNVFDGNASTLDPVTATVPNGVSTTNSMTIFSIGYRWGT